MQRHLVDRAERQHGVLTRAQLVAAGHPLSTVGDWVADGRLTIVQPGVYRVAGAPVTWESNVAAALLACGPGAAVSHRSAARLWGLGDYDEVEVTVPITRGPRLRKVIVHRSRDVDVVELRRRHGFVVTSPMLTLVDLAAVVERFVVEQCLDVGLSKRLYTIDAVIAARDEVGRKGRRGAGVVGRILDTRALGAKRPDDPWLEPRMARLIKNHGLPEPLFQYWVTIRGNRFRLDFVYLELKIVIEIDGFESHATPEAMQRDLRRQNLLVLDGWIVLRFTRADIVKRPAWVAEQIRVVLCSVTAK